MRSVQDIESQITASVANDVVLSEKLTSTSKVSIWRLIVFIVSYAIFLHEQIVEKNAENSRPHTKLWYREQALGFMDGFELIWKDGQFKYDTSGMSDAAIQEAKTITHVAITEAANGVLVIKTAAKEGMGTVPINSGPHSRFQSYMEQIKDAGNRIQYINQPADDLRLELIVWVDDLIIDVDTGESLVVPGTFPVEDACKIYLDALEFNGAFIKTFLVDAIQQMDGVHIPKVQLLEHRTLANPFESVEEYVLPFSGHFKYSELTINYKAYNEVA